MARIYGAPGVQPTLRGQPTNVFTLKAGEAFLIPAGTWNVETGPYSAYQEYDPITGIWRSVGGDDTRLRWVQSDGVNSRVANQNGCVVGAVVTTAGSGYTSAPTVTASSGSAVFRAIVGGAVSTSVTVTNGGSGYTYTPIVQFDAPPAGGVQATGYATLSGGAVASVTITDQGAGYANAPNVTFINDPRDDTGVGAAATTVLTGSNTVTAVVVTDHGTPVSGTSVPTLSFSGGGGSSAAALAIMNWSITAYTVNSAGSGYSGTVEVSALGTGYVGTASAITNPTIQTNLVRTRKASIVAALSGVGVTSTGQTVLDGGIYTGISAAYQIIVNPAQYTAGSTANLAFTYGGNNDTVKLYAV